MDRCSAALRLNEFIGRTATVARSRTAACTTVPLRPPSRAMGARATFWRLRRIEHSCIHFRRLQRLAGMIGSVVIQILIFDFGLRQQQLTLRRKRQIVRHVQVFEHLLRNAMEDWGRNLSALM